MLVSITPLVRSTKQKKIFKVLIKSWNYSNKKKIPCWGAYWHRQLISKHQNPISLNFFELDARLFRFGCSMYSICILCSPSIRGVANSSFHFCWSTSWKGWCSHHDLCNWYQLPNQSIVPKLNEMKILFCKKKLFYQCSIVSNEIECIFKSNHPIFIFDVNVLFGSILQLFQNLIMWIDRFIDANAM